MFNNNLKETEKIRQEVQKELVEKQKQKLDEVHQVRLELLDSVKKYLLMEEKEKEKNSSVNDMTENIFVSSGEYIFNTEGYDHNYLYVSNSDEGKELKVSYLSVNYTITLKAGFNELKLRNNAVLTGEGFNAIIIRSNVKY